VSIAWAVIIALGSISALLLWILKRWFTIGREIANLKGQVDEITVKIVHMERKPATYTNVTRLTELRAQRDSLNRQIRRYTVSKPKSLFGR